MVNRKCLFWCYMLSNTVVDFGLLSFKEINVLIVHLEHI